MSTGLQIKLLAAILAVLGVVAALLVKQNRGIQIDRQAQDKVEHKVAAPHRYLVP